MTLTGAEAAWLVASPAYMITRDPVPTGWFTVATVHEAVPEASVVPLQDCAALPDPRVKRIDWPASGTAPGFCVSTAEKLVEAPFANVLGPV